MKEKKNEKGGIKIKPNICQLYFGNAGVTSCKQKKKKATSYKLNVAASVVVIQWLLQLVKRRINALKIY